MEKDNRENQIDMFYNRDSFLWNEILFLKKKFIHDMGKRSISFYFWLKKEQNLSCGKYEGA